jgi:hypothetical protein
MDGVTSSELAGVSGLVSVESSVLLGSGAFSSGFVGALGSGVAGVPSGLDAY